MAAAALVAAEAMAQRKSLEEERDDVVDEPSSRSKSSSHSSRTLSPVPTVPPHPPPPAGTDEKSSSRTTPGPSPPPPPAPEPVQVSGPARVKREDSRTSSPSLSSRLPASAALPPTEPSPSSTPAAAKPLTPAEEPPRAHEPLVSGRSDTSRAISSRSSLTQSHSTDVSGSQAALTNFSTLSTTEKVCRHAHFSAAMAPFASISISMYIALVVEGRPAAALAGVARRSERGEGAARQIRGVESSCAPHVRTFFQSTVIFISDCKVAEVCTCSNLCACSTLDEGVWWRCRWRRVRATRSS